MGLQPITKYIVLDVSINKYISVLVKQNDVDVREIIVTITDNGKPYPIDSTITPWFNCQKADGTYIVNDEICTILDNGTIKIDVIDQMTVCDGIHHCDLSLFDYKSNRLLHTMDFNINVRKTAVSENEISSKDDFIALENALLKIETTTEIERITESEIDALFS